MELAYVYENYGEALEADFFAFWHVDINEVSLRRMRNLYFRLPVMCQTKFDMADTPEEARYWSIDTYMLANVIDAVQAMDWHLIAANSKKPPKPPKPFPRPETKKKVAQTGKKAMWPGKTIVDNGVKK